MEKPIRIASFYQFSPLTEAQLPGLQEALIQKAEELGVQGLVIMGVEGMNSTFAGLKTACIAFETFIRSIPGFETASFKISYSDLIPFRRFKIQIRSEIVTIGRPDIRPNQVDDSHLSPEEWNRVLNEEQDFVLIDTRNWYESEIGKFENAICPPITEFTEFPKWVAEQNIPKDKKVLIYCTGGIRCEKAQVEMTEQGFENVFQLKDGILKYMEEFPEQKFEGECFVFDHRVAVNQKLEASEKYDLCPHCGQPGLEEIDCAKCDTHAKVCKRCLEKGPQYNTCSKNCAHHYTRNPLTKTRRQEMDLTGLRKYKKSLRPGLGTITTKS